LEEVEQNSKEQLKGLKTSKTAESTISYNATDEKAIVGGPPADQQIAAGPGKLRRALNFVCGVDTANMEEAPVDARTPTEKAKDAADFLDEPPVWSRCA
jgi:hypothetical protein